MPRLWPQAVIALAVASCGGVEREPQPFDWREDDRLKTLLATTSPRGHFTGDTGDMLPVMVEKLATGKPLVQNHYRGELSAGGDRVVVLIEDLIHRYGATQNGTLVIGNALGVIGLSDSDLAVRVARRMLGHPAESVRTAAIRAMAKLARGEDYELLQGLMPLVNGETRRALVQAMGCADPQRLGGDLLDWIQGEEDVALCVLAARAVAEADAGASLDRACLDAETAQHPNLRPFLVAALAGAGDGDAMTLLELMLVDPSELIRTRALEAVRMVGLESSLVSMATEDTSESIRVLAVEGVAELIPSEVALSALRVGVRDDSPQVRQASLKALLSSSDESADALFLEMVRAGPSELGPAFRAVRGAWGQREGLVELTASELMGLLGGMGDRSLKEREPWIQALGQVPSEDGAGWLLELARSSQGERHSLSAHRWLVLQISNSAAPGRELLMNSWRDEEDLERRLDYLWAASMSREPETIDFLLDVVLGDKALDHERLFAANCLVRTGETLRVAPLLKRACLKVTDPLVRPAFEELLWLWYS